MLNSSQTCDVLCNYVRNYAYDLGNCNGKLIHEATALLFYKRFGFTFNCDWICPSEVILVPPVIDPIISDDTCIELTVNNESSEQCTLIPRLTVQ